MQHRIFLATMGFALAALLAGCGGTGLRAGGPDSGNAGSAGGMVDAGGTGGQTGQGGSGGTGQDGHDSMGDASKASEHGRDAMLAPDSYCETLRLELAVTAAFCTSGPTCRCYLTDDQQESIGTLSLDADGRVVDNSRMSDQEETQWLDGLGAMRWPCLASQTILYTCRFAG